MVCSHSGLYESALITLGGHMTVSILIGQAKGGCLTLNREGWVFDGMHM